MKPRHLLLLGVIPALLGAGVVVAHWQDTRSATGPQLVTQAQAQPDTKRQPLYYRDPSGGAEFSATPKTDAQGRDFVPMFEDSAPAPAVASKPQAAPAEPRRVLYYRNPMGLPDTSKVPKKDSMGMDYVPVYAEEESQAPGTVTVSPERVQMLGVRTDLVSRRAMTRTIRAVGTVAVDERRLVVIAPRFEGWIERLLVNQTGQAVRHGEPLFETYSPELTATAREAAIARQARADMAEADASVRGAAAEIAGAAAARLRNFGVTQGASRAFTVTAPIDGVVLEKNAVQGMRFAPGDTLYRIADLSAIWVIADVFERDLGGLRLGEMADIALTSYPDRRFSGTVTFIYPSLNAATRTGRVRIEIQNADLLLKPDMYATVEIAGDRAAAPVAAVPESAVLDSGTQQAVLVERATGRYEPRRVVTGTRANGFVEIRSGVMPGEKVVVSANFLIDAESNLRAALQSFTTDQQVQAK